MSELSETVPASQRSLLDRPDVLRSGVAVAALSAVTASNAAAQDATGLRAVQPPNIVIILADDLGNADLGYRGHEVKTPNIDKLAAGRVRLESFYGQPVCTPARAALMTGRYPMRYGLQTLVIFPSHTYGLPTDERTLAQFLKDVGYQTALVGKWHLGHADRKYWLQNGGFEHFYGDLVGEVDYFTKERGGIVDWQRNGKFLQEDGYYTTLIGNEAVRLIEEHDTSRPLFLYFASLAPHAPYQAPQDYLDRYPLIEDKNRQTYAAIISALDDQVGRIVAALQKRNMRDNRINIFSQRQWRGQERAHCDRHFLGAQGKTFFDPDFDIDDAGLPHEKPVIPHG